MTSPAALLPPVLALATATGVRSRARLCACAWKIEPLAPKSQQEWLRFKPALTPEWLFARALLHRVGLHHGRLPRTLSQYVVRAFNEERVRFLVCTSTLIEGVNTKAKNVIVFDNKVARSKFDYFTYNNILGRSGRMFQHFVGHVYIFHEPPQEELPLVDIPVLTQPDDAPESLLMQIDEDDLTAGAKGRISDILDQRDLPVDVIRASKGVDPRAQVRLAAETRGQAAALHPLLSWTGFPTYGQLVAACELVWKHFVSTNQRRAGVSSGKQLAFRIDNFRKLGSVSAFMRDQLARSGEKGPDDTVEDAIEFLRYWANVNFPRMLMTLDRIQRHVFEKRGQKAGNYAFYASRIENWLLDPAIMALDEYGIPVQIGQKLERRLNPAGDLDMALSRLRAQADFPGLTLFERALVRDAKSHV